MGRDSIFRIYSMTKPMVSVAAMMMVEEGKLLLEAPVARYIPAFANVRVGVEKVDANGNKSLELVAPRRPITVQDLLRHTSGLTYGFFGESLVKKANNEVLVTLPPTTNNAEFADALAKLPLHYQPGSTWDYSYSTDVRPRARRCRRQSLYAVLKQRLLDPLGMKDTSFYVPESARQARIAEPLPDDRSFGVNANISDPRVVRNLESGGGGMVSTADDYARFAQMLLNGGALDGKRYLSPKTLEFGPAIDLGCGSQDRAVPAGAGYGFGLAFATRLRRVRPRASAPGEFYGGRLWRHRTLVDPRTNSRRLHDAVTKAACRTFGVAQHGSAAVER